jgi:spermidine synthase
MRPWDLLGETSTAAGEDLKLMRRGGEYVIFANGSSLMSSRMHGSEEALAAIGCHTASKRPLPTVLIAGLGMGFTLRAALDLLPAGATVLVSELVPAVIEWNKGALGALAGHPLADPRVRVEVADVAATLEESSCRFDAVLLDVDNGPAAFTAAGNAGLYSDAGLAAIRRALVPDGVVAVWSAWEDRRFEQRLRYGGFTVRVERVRARLSKGGPHHTIFIGSRQPDDCRA